MCTMHSIYILYILKTHTQYGLAVRGAGLGGGGGDSLKTTHD